MHKLEQTGTCGNMEGQDQHLPLSQGSTILGGRYRLVQLLHQRPRLNLYLGRRISPQHHSTRQSREQEPLVAIRELVLTDLSPQVRIQIEQAAFEEFVSPLAPGSPRSFDAGDRVFIEGEQHYRVTQLSEDECCSAPITLAELLREPQWPSWLDTTRTLTWGVQLCRMVARLHRLGTVLSDLNPNTVLVDRYGVADWPPVLLASWPPPPRFWPTSSTSSSAREQCTQIFPIAEISSNNPFAAPEVFDGVYDERSDVYSLGALLYLLYTHYAPAAALRRQHAALVDVYTRKGGVSRSDSDLLFGSESMALIPPRLLNSGLSSALEDVLLRALAFDPAERYLSAFALVEALEGVYYERLVSLT